MSISSRLAREEDPEILRKAVALLERHNVALTKKLSGLANELMRAQAELAALKGESFDKQLRITALEQHIAKLTKQIFGPSSERRETEAEGAGESEDPKGGEKPKGKEKRTGHGPKAQPKLPTIEVEHDLDEADKVCPKCGDELHPMNGQYEEHDEIDVVPMRFVIKRHRRKKYGCSCGGHIETAPGPDKLCPGGRYSINFAIYVVVSKYGDHLPLERQVRMMVRDGLDVTSQTLWDQIEQLTWLVEAVMPRLLAYVLSHSVVGADETTWKLMGAKAPHHKSWFVWVLRVETAVFYALRDARSAKVAEGLLATFQGVLMCDGYEAYATLASKHSRVVLAHCWVHVRREFLEIEKSFPVCRQVLDLIGKLYEIERRCTKEGLDRRALRDTESREIVEKIVGWFFVTLPTCLPESGLRKALGYMVNMWTGLVLFLDDPAIPLDNNGTERAARSPVLGRKNHYGSRSLRGTEVAATLYSLVETSKLNDLDPRFYLRVAARAGLRHETVPLPHEVKARLTDGSLDPTDYDDFTEGIVLAALASAAAAKRAPTPLDGNLNPADSSDVS